MKIEIKKITKKYNNNSVLNNITIEFKLGRTYCVLGKNGAGKSTLFNILMNLVSKSSGEILYDNKVYDALPKYIKRKIGFLSENIHVIEELTAFQYLKFIGTLYEINSSELNKRISELLNIFFNSNLNINKKQILNFSTGMKKIVAFCGAIIHLPEVLILDEPFAGLDTISAHRVINVINSFRKANRVLVFSSHNFEYVEKMKPDVLIIIDKGNIIFQGSIDDFTRNGETKLDKALLKAFNFEKDTQNSKLSWL